EYVYVDTATGDVSYRNRVKLFHKVDGFATMEAYASYQRATRALVEWHESHRNRKGNPTVEGFDGPTWTPYLPLDFDHESDPAVALTWLRRVVEKLRSWDVDLRAVRFYFSGHKGFHAE